MRKLVPQHSSVALSHASECSPHLTSAPASLTLTRKKDFSIENVAGHWSELPREVVESSPSKGFRKQLDVALNALVQLAKWSQVGFIDL